MKIVNVFVVAASLHLAGCAEMSAKSCASTNWYWEGYADGRRTEVSLFDAHARHCKAFGIEPDAAQYQSGLSNGRFDRAHRISSN